MKTIFRGANGRISSKRVLGAVVIVNALFISQIRPETETRNSLVRDMLATGCALLATTVFEKKHIESNTDEK